MAIFPERRSPSFSLGYVVYLQRRPKNTPENIFIFITFASINRLKIMNNGYFRWSEFQREYAAERYIKIITLILPELFPGIFILAHHHGVTHEA
ncbi:hypothetical protein [Enterobacter asburiae]|uniref:hypothetical protein n=1 Tax=Enterobacter asburiae TaxID=61645 RepID=UPI0026482011|nr:hypothetical protein [Enterobacter asburiae]WKE07156.1 hypothetical protein QOM24_13695 [Enterobacter asburiae]